MTVRVSRDVMIAIAKVHAQAQAYKASKVVIHNRPSQNTHSPETFLALLLVVYA